MVNHQPYYDLAEVKAAVLQGRWQFSRRAVRDYTNLGYNQALALRIISELNPRQYHKSIEYNAYVCDVYYVTHMFGDFTDNLYIKFFMTDHIVNLQVVSFHL